MKIKMIDKKYRDEAESRYKEIIDRAFMYGDVMEHTVIERTRSSSTVADSEYTINLKMEFRSSEVDIDKLEEAIRKIMDSLK